MMATQHWDRIEFYLNEKGVLKHRGVEGAEAGMALDPDPFRCAETMMNKDVFWRVEFAEEICLEVIYISVPEMPVNEYGREYSANTAIESLVVVFS
jgi:hypothetical protein